MSTTIFLSALQDEVEGYSAAVSTDDGDCIVKGFIDTYRRIYAMPGDTKVISKVLELFLVPGLLQFAARVGYTVELAAQQNFYPDLSFVSQHTPDVKYALDIKSTYRVSAEKVNGMTLGAFTGYFRDRNSTKNTQYPYGAYRSHLVLGVIYSRVEPPATGTQPDPGYSPQTYTLDDMERVRSAIRDMRFFVQPKYRIASARPGSGNTRNIGSVTSIERLVNGAGPFSGLGEAIYDDYWMNYLNADMARKIGSKPPYNNLESYALHKNQGKRIDVDQAAQLDALDADDVRGRTE